MTLTLENFKQLIDPTILERGLSYAHDGRVLALEEEGDNDWTAQVEGTRLYTVSIEQTVSGGLSCLCTRPFDWGLTCKHITAVLYTIQGATPRKEDVPAETLRRLLKKQDKEELVDFLTEIPDWDSQVMNWILTRYQNEGTSKQGYKELVRGMLDRIQGPPIKGVWELLRRARAEAAAGQVKTALSIFQSCRLRNRQYRRCQQHAGRLPYLQSAWAGRRSTIATP